MSTEFDRGAACARGVIADWLEREGSPGLAVRIYSEIPKAAWIDPLVRPAAPVEAPRCGWCLGTGSVNRDPSAVHTHPECPAAGDLRAALLSAVEARGATEDLTTCQRWTAQVAGIVDRLRSVMPDCPPDADLVDEAVRRIASPADEGARPDDLRAAGWAVAVHNDYRLGGVPYTFWLLTKGDRCVKGEGRSDAEALNEIRAALAFPSAPAPSTAATGDR